MMQNRKWRRSPESGNIDWIELMITTNYPIYIIIEANRDEAKRI